MKQFVLHMFLIAGIFAAGCAEQKNAIVPTRAASVSPSVIVTPDDSVAGKVVFYNSDGRFAVLNFSDGRMPQAGQLLFLYRLGLKAAEVKITGPQMNKNIVADLIGGNAQVGDEVRNQ